MLLMFLVGDQLWASYLGGRPIAKNVAENLLIFDMI